MVKFARKEDKPFDPISAKVLSSLASTPAAREPEEAPRATPPDEATPEAEPGLTLVSPVVEARSGTETQAEESQEEGEGKRSRKARNTGTKRRAAEEGEPERLNRVVRCLLSPSEEKVLRALVTRLGKRAGTSLTLSHLIRPYFDLLLHSEDELAEELSQAGISRPHNDKTAIVHYEHKVAAIIHSALRKAHPFGAGPNGKKTR